MNVSTKMWLLALSLLSVIYTSQAACPGGWVPDAGSTWCYGLLPIKAYPHSYDARQACLAQSGDLLRLKDIEAHQKTAGLVSGISGTVNIYLGIHFSSGSYKYLSSADSISYTKSYTGPNAGNCVIMTSANWTDTSVGEWKRVACCTDQSISHVVCEKPFSGTTTVTQANDKLYQECYGSSNACSSNPCQNSGTCQNTLPSNSTYTCKCLTGKTGLHCETDLTCPTVTTTTYGNATYTPPGSTAPGTTFVVNCKSGFKFGDRTTTKTMKCETSGVWSPATKGCTSHCPDVPTIVNADVDNAGTAIGHVVNFTCVKGYQFPDNTTIMNLTCQQDAKWSTPPAQLPPCSIISCPKLPTYEHQSRNTQNETFNTTVIFWCDVGYTLSDNTTARTITCTETGEWSAKLPPCLPVTCPIIHPVAKGTRNSSQNIFDSFVEYRCDTGYRMEDGAAWRIIKCDATGVWSDNVTDCDLNRCYPLPFVANATPSTLVARINTRVTFTCIQGHKFFLSPISKTDEQSIICKTDNGRMRWDPSLTGCQPIQCPVLKDEIANQNRKNLVPLSDARLYGAVVIIQCHKGHYKQDNSSSEVVECLSTEVWNKTTYEECEPVKCGQPPVKDNGTASQNFYGKSTFQYLDLVYYECNDEHKFLDGRTTLNITCNEFGNWNESDLSCRKERCDPIPRKANVKPNTTATNWYTVVKYECQEGFKWDHTAPVLVNCDNRGTWQNAGQLKDCTPKECSTLPTQHNSTHNGTRSTNENYVYGDFVKFTCNQGYKYTKDNVKSQVMSCNVNGQWAPATLDPCEPIDCGKLDPIENATLQTNDTNYGIDIVYKCNDGYQFPDKERQKTVHCRAGENDTVGYYEWFKFKTENPKKKANHCEVVFCPPVPAWSETEFNSTVNEFESVVLYWCQDGYQFKTCVSSSDTYSECKKATDLITTTTEIVAEETTAMVNGSSGGGTKTKEIKRTQSTCIEAKKWDPPFLDCESIKKISADVKGVVTESKDGATFGIFAISLLVVTAVTLVLLDLNKLFSDCKLMKSNIQYFINKKKKNKVSDSTISIDESTA